LAKAGRFPAIPTSRWRISITGTSPSANPRGFLAEHSEKVHHDEGAEVRRTCCPTSQTAVDENASPGRYILTGSQQFHLFARVSQFAGRPRRLSSVLPFSLSELLGRPPLDPQPTMVPRTGERLPRV